MHTQEAAAAAAACDSSCVSEIRGRPDESLMNFNDRRLKMGHSDGNAPKIQEISGGQGEER